MVYYFNDNLQFFDPDPDTNNFGPDPANRPDPEHCILWYYFWTPTLPLQPGTIGTLTNMIAPTYGEKNRYYPDPKEWIRSCPFPCLACGMGVTSVQSGWARSAPAMSSSFRSRLTTVRSWLTYPSRSGTEATIMHLFAVVLRRANTRNCHAVLSTGVARHTVKGR